MPSNARPRLIPRSLLRGSLFEGKPWKHKCLSQIGALIEAPSLYGNLTAEENLMVHTRLLGIPKKRIDEVLDIVDLKNTNKRRAAKFSMGMKQRLGIAIALLNNPKLLMDEPTNGLDPFGVKERRELIASFPGIGKAQQKSIELVLSIDKNVPDYVPIDSEFLARILDNLLSNSLQY